MFVCTLGDPFSVNVELVVNKLVSLDQGQALHFPIVLVGSRQQWCFQLDKLNVSGKVPECIGIQDLDQACEPGFFFLDVGGAWQDPRSLSALEAGKIAMDSLLTLDGFKPKAQLAVLTCPIDKLACSTAGFSFIGQTEFFESIWDGQAVMTLAGKRLKVGLASNHLPLADVPSSLSAELICQKILKLGSTLKNFFHYQEPRIGVCGLNPHCGEGGLVGREEISLIAPAIKEAQKSSNFEVIGPLPADTIFWQALQGRFDGVLAMYHDQGLGPLKTVHFDSAINLSGGLKHLRVSPDHGPAKDLVFSGQASTLSFDMAWDTCTDYLKG